MRAQCCQLSPNDAIDGFAFDEFGGVLTAVLDGRLPHRCAPADAADVGGEQLPVWHDVDVD